MHPSTTWAGIRIFDFPFFLLGDQSLPVRASSPIQRFTGLQQSLRNMIVRWLLDLIKPVRRRKSPSPQSSTSSADGGGGGGDVATPVTPGPPGSGTEHRKSITYHLSVDVSTLSAEERRSHGKKLLRYVLMSLKDNIELMHNVCYQVKGNGVWVYFSKK